MVLVQAVDSSTGRPRYDAVCSALSHKRPISDITRLTYGETPWEVIYVSLAYTRHT